MSLVGYRTYAALKSMDPESELRATADEFPRFMYPDNQEYDAEDEEAGLFKTVSY